jgi:hypothetical protein
LAGMTAGAGMLDGRHEHAARRAAIIAANPGLQERELHKLTNMAAMAAAALRERGAREPVASLAAQSAVTVFQVAFTQWVATPDEAHSFAEFIARTAAELRAIV